MDTVSEALLFPYRKGLLPPANDSRVLFLGADSPIKGMNITPVQWRYDKAAPFIKAGYNVLFDPPEEKFDTVWVLPRKDLQETQHLLAQAVISVREGGILVAAAANDAGGKRLKELFRTLGLSPDEESKHKARVVFAAVEQYDAGQAGAWLKGGQEQKILDGSLLSRPGLHGWDKIDEGSALLVRHLPPDLKGTVADFGCGWGYLSLEAAKASQKITRLTLVDIDARALSLAERNLKRHHPSLPVTTVWTDLTTNIRLGPFDAVLLNPPFHDGTHAVPVMGQAIIATAARSLTPAGRLFLIANKHLPYEKTLQTLFSKTTLLAEEKGFKAFECTL